MSEYDDYRELVLKLGRKRPHRRAPKSRFHETSDTRTLGALSTSVGVVVLILLFLPRVQVPLLGFYESPLADQRVHSTAGVVFALTAVAGEWLGLAGILLARFRGRLLSPLCLVGSVLCVLAAGLCRIAMPQELLVNIMFLCLIVVLPPMFYSSARKILFRPTVEPHASTVETPSADRNQLP
jgi:hypothetical protein